MGYGGGGGGGGERRGKVGGGMVRGKGQVWKGYRMPKGLQRLLKSLLGGGWAEIKYSVCPCPSMRPRVA